MTSKRVSSAGGKKRATKRKASWGKTVAKRSKGAHTAGTQIVPLKYHAKLTYGEEVTLGYSSKYAWTNFTGNDMFDPNPALGGHQPRGFEQQVAF